MADKQDEMPNEIWVSKLLADNKLGIQMCSAKRTAKTTVKYTRTPSKPTDEAREALEILDRVRNNTPHNEEPYRRDALDKVYHTFRAALDQQTADDAFIEGLKKSFVDGGIFMDSWNNCLDHLHARGLITNGESDG